LLYEGEVITREKGKLLMRPMVRSIDSTGNIQQGKEENCYNARGLLNDTPHSIDIEITK